jgi:hypothetical protein
MHTNVQERQTPLPVRRQKLHTAGPEQENGPFQERQAFQKRIGDERKKAFSSNSPWAAARVIAVSLAITFIGACIVISAITGYISGHDRAAQLHGGEPYLSETAVGPGIHEPKIVCDLHEVTASAFRTPTPRRTRHCSA